MCGIIGCFNENNIDKQLFVKQLLSIEHRGPDDEGFWLSKEGTIALGSRRLAIQDISSNGHMPMISEDDRYVIVLNGEIYNHPILKQILISDGFKFKSNSDTETVLYSYIKWGKECVNYLEGMFAFAIHDKYEQTIFIARDIAGEKPLYYNVFDTGIEFASEMKALLQNTKVDRKLNPLAFQQYLNNGFVGNDVTFIVGLKKLPAAHFLLYDLKLKSYTVSRYWHVPNFENKNIAEQDLLSKLDILLSKSVKDQLISDLPVGVLLSGGLDSSLIAAYAAENYSSKIKTFNISFNGFGKFDESVYAKKVAQHFDTEHIELSGNDLSFEMIDRILDYYDEPIADSSVLPTFLVSELTKQYVTVALGGDGGDELFGGYTNYKELLKVEKIKTNQFSFLFEGIAKIASYLPVGLKGRNYLMSFEGSSYENFLKNKFFDDKSILDILNENYIYQNLDTNNKKIIKKTGNILYDITKYDFENYMCEDILVKVDRASMASSLELRAPWLNKNIIEFAFSEVPSYLKANKLNTKILPKKLAKMKLPSNLDINRKQGFSIPISDWIKDRWFKQFEEEINDLPENLFNRKKCLQLLHNEKKGFSNSHRLFALIIFNKWFKKYKVHL
jgi:asparagine synthase (glutamine-hydrolysing)